VFHSRTFNMDEVSVPNGSLMDSTSSRSLLTPESSRLFRVYRTISSMLTKRGYMVPRDMREMTPAAFTERFGEYPTREALTILVVCYIVFF